MMICIHCEGPIPESRKGSNYCCEECQRKGPGPQWQEPKWEGSPDPADEALGIETPEAKQQ